MNTISEITRRNIFDALTVEKVNWAGRLDEPAFLSRMFDLSQLPSYDNRFKDAARDIWQHRINNPTDWPDDWVFSDDRFDLLKCEDAVFLRFLCEMLHPIVRSDLAEVNRLKQLFNEYLKEDGYELVEKTFISGRPIFAARQKPVADKAIAARTAEITAHLSEEYVVTQITLMEGAITSAPHIAIGVAKELVETCCRSILDERTVAIDKGWDLPRLLRETNKTLKLTPEDIPDETKAVETIRSILGSLSNVVQGIAELRNSYGSGHGRDSDFKGLSPRHAKLAVGAASTLAIFLLETHKIRGK
ncbi:MAG: abortive infection family protein [Ignavibacterium sp.]|jgi:hypothetical protein